LAFTLETTNVRLIVPTGEVVEVEAGLAPLSWPVDGLIPATSTPAATPPRPASSRRTGSAEAGAAAARASRTPGRAR
jgi:hypothetical protein